METENITLRSAIEQDASLLLEFLRKKASFDASMEAFTGDLQTSEEAIRETLFGCAPFARVLFAEFGGRAVGFALYYFGYSSFKGRPHLWLDDLFVNERVRSQGVGTALMRRLSQIALAHQCTHMAWTASAKNLRGIGFYERLGAKVVEQQGNRLLFQADAQAMGNMAQQV